MFVHRRPQQIPSCNAASTRSRRPRRPLPRPRARPPRRRQVVSAVPKCSVVRF